MWLAVQLWLELLVAAAFGGVIGWALQMRFGKQPASGTAPAAAPAFQAGADADGRVRIAELETKLKAERGTAEELRRKLAESAAAESADVEGSLAWRNRYMESRIRFLEGKVADLEGQAAPEQPKPEEDDEATRLRWRNRYLDGRVKYLEEELVRTGGLRLSEVGASAGANGSAHAANDGDRPAALDGPRDGKADNLKKITGVGPKLEQTLNGYGVWHYDQIAAWTTKELDWINAAMSLRGRAERENWVGQASQLAQGIEPAPKPKARTKAV